MRKSQDDDAYEEARVFKRNAVLSAQVREAVNGAIDDIGPIINQLLNAAARVRNAGNDRVKDAVDDFSVTLMKLSDEAAVALGKIQESPLA